MKSSHSDPGFPSRAVYIPVEVPGGAVLSWREFCVLKGIACGVSLEHVAKLLHISEKTARTYRARLLEKMNMPSVAHITVWAHVTGHGLRADEVKAVDAEFDQVAGLLEEARDMLSDARIESDMLRAALGVDYEPHQTLFERMLDAANHKRVERAIESHAALREGSTVRVPGVGEL